MGGLAIGMVVTAMACGLGPASGGAFNPAVGTMGLFIAGHTHLWIYWLACPLGGLLAACCFRIQNFQEFQASTERSGADAQHAQTDANQGQVDSPGGSQESGDAFAA